MKRYFQTWLSALTSSRCGRIAFRFFSINSSAFMFIEWSRIGQRPRRAPTEKDGEDKMSNTDRASTHYPNNPQCYKAKIKMLTWLWLKSGKRFHSEEKHFLIPMDGWWVTMRISMAKFSASVGSPHWLAEEQITHSASSRTRGGM